MLREDCMRTSGSSFVCELLKVLMVQSTELFDSWSRNMRARNMNSQRTSQDSSSFSVIATEKNLGISHYHRTNVLLTRAWLQRLAAILKNSPVNSLNWQPQTVCMSRERTALFLSEMRRLERNSDTS